MNGLGTTLFDALRASGEYCATHQYADLPVETTEVEEGDYPDW